MADVIPFPPTDAPSPPCDSEPCGFNLQTGEAAGALPEALSMSNEELDKVRGQIRSREERLQSSEKRRAAAE